MTLDTYSDDHLADVLYDELREIASYRLRGERRSHSLSTTDLVHEAYLRLARNGVTFRGDAQYRFLAARAMRRVLVDLARKRGRVKRGGDPIRVSLHAADLVHGENADSLLQLDDALTRLASTDRRAAEVVTMRFFGGFTQEEIAEALGVTDRTVRNVYAYARAELRRLLDDGTAGG